MIASNSMIDRASDTPHHRAEHQQPRLGRIARRPLVNGQRGPWLHGEFCLLMVILLLLFTNAGYGQDYGVCDEIYLPLASFKNRQSYGELSKRKLDGFGAYRRAGHKHAGLDIKAGFSELVYPIGQGKVIKIYERFPQQTVLVEHKTASGLVFYSSYTHLMDITAKVDDRVDQNTPIGRVFKLDELRKTRFGRNHLHLEIRKTMENYDRISISCHTVEELNRNFYDPLEFMKRYLSIIIHEKHDD